MSCFVLYKEAHLDCKEEQAASQGTHWSIYMTAGSMCRMGGLTMIAGVGVPLTYTTDQAVDGSGLSPGLNCEWMPMLP